MTEFGTTTKDDPRIPVGTRVQFTSLPMQPSGRIFYDNGGPGTVEADDGTLEVPYLVRLDTPVRALGLSAHTVLADYNELEILP